MAEFLGKSKKLLGSIALAALIVLTFSLDVFSYIEHKAQDAVYQRPGAVDAPDIYVFGIDEKSQAELGRYQQWTRQIMADAVNILNGDEEYKPAVIAIDILYIGVGDDKTADDNLAKAAENGGNVVVASHGVIGSDRENYSLEQIMIEHETPYPDLAASSEYGLSNAIPDEDGVIRSALMKADYNGETIYSFPFEIYRKYMGEDISDYVSDYVAERDELYLTYSQQPGGYYGAAGAGLSFSDIFSDEFEPEFFADCIVMIGPYATGMMDAHYTAVNSSEQMYGVEIHANAVQMLIDENIKEHISPVVNLLLLLAVIVLGILAQRLDIRLFLGFAIAFCVAYVFSAVWLFGMGYIAMLVYPIFAIALLYLYQLIYGYVLEAVEKQKVKSAFKKYVDPKLVDKLIETGEAHSNEVGVKKNIAILFVDVRGFTPMTEALSDRPELVVKILNEYLELTSSSVFNNGGSVDKFVGDATMALFNGFVPLDDYVFKAVKAAWDIVQGAAELNASIKEKYGVDLGFGVGVNCGEAIVGNLGPSFRKDYTAIGDAVNTAARLESNAKRSEVLISKNVYDVIRGRIEAVSVGEIPLKGKSAKLEVFSVVNITTVS